MQHYDHVALIMQGYYAETPDGPVEVRYSRVLCDTPVEERWAYFEKQVADMDPAIRLLAVVDDIPHEHPQVITAEGVQPSDDTAHMP